MTDQQTNFSCFCCNNEFQFSHGNYRGEKIIGYEIMVCESCYEANWDGWSPHIENKLIQHLENSGIRVPLRNNQFWLPREYL